MRLQLFHFRDVKFRQKVEKNMRKCTKNYKTHPYIDRKILKDMSVICDQRSPSCGLVLNQTVRKLYVDTNNQDRSFMRLSVSFCSFLAKNKRKWFCQKEVILLFNLRGKIVAFSDSISLYNFVGF